MQKIVYTSLALILTLTQVFTAISNSYAFTASNAWQSPLIVQDQIGTVGNTRTIQYYDGSVSFVWQDETGAIKAQKISKYGESQWGITPIIVRYSSIKPATLDDVKTDHNGGIVATWTEGKLSDRSVHFQIVNSDGQRVIGPNDTRVTTSTNIQRGSAVASDSNGNYFAVWHEMQAGENTYKLYAKKYDSAGYTIWIKEIPNVQSITTSGIQAHATNGALILTWVQRAAGGSTESMYSTVIKSDGSIETPSQIVTSESIELRRVVNDNNGNAYFGYVINDSVQGVTNQSRIIGINLDGTVSLPQTEICPGCNVDNFEMAYSPTSNTVSVAFQTNIGAMPSLNISAQMISISTKARLWGDNGITVINGEEGTAIQGISADNNGNIYVLANEGSDQTSRIRLQKVSQSGDMLWGSNGVSRQIDENGSFGEGLGVDGADGVILLVNTSINLLAIRVSDGYQVDNLLSNLDITNILGSIKVGSQNGVVLNHDTGLYNSPLNVIDTSKNATVMIISNAVFPNADIDLNSFVVLNDYTTGRSFIDGYTTVGFTSDYTLYMPIIKIGQVYLTNGSTSKGVKSLTDLSVTLCPNPTMLSSVKAGCTGAIILKNNQSQGAISAKIVTGPDGKLYWEVKGLEGDFGGLSTSVTSRNRR